MWQSRMGGIHSTATIATIATIQNGRYILLRQLRQWDNSDTISLLRSSRQSRMGGMYLEIVWQSRVGGYVLLAATVQESRLYGYCNRTLLLCDNPERIMGMWTLSPLKCTMVEALSITFICTFSSKFGETGMGNLEWGIQNCIIAIIETIATIQNCTATIATIATIQNSVWRNKHHLIAR